MKKTALVLATVGTLGVSAVAAPKPAEAHWHGGFGPALAGGLVAGAIFGGLASSAYAYGPGYGYYGPGYGYAPAYYGGYYPWGGYTTTYYRYAPAYYGYRYHRIVRPAYAYYGGPFPRRHFFHHRWYHHW
ncbi:hypothetical protein [Bradyrhizobium sp. Gha]|uniref:hypothetical protein n=1 Tax=Bradyrhizobium sp. Gha TaxID=1855318 RepID=UPI0008E76FB9|nr:hypothetical protein [Bradyrhizobium sp. Gha]SFI24763.1 hypothetical protein SAMN05216525_106140 [Bradyrhizobium sp. Gha]